MVKKISQAKPFLTKPVMYLTCMISTLTHAARVFKPASPTTHGRGLVNTKVHLKSESLNKMLYFFDFIFPEKTRSSSFSILRSVIIGSPVYPHLGQIGAGVKISSPEVSNSIFSVYRMCVAVHFGQTRITSMVRFIGGWRYVQRPGGKC